MRGARQAGGAVALCFGVVAVILVASCRQVADIGDPAPPPTCKPPLATPRACGDCMIDACCAEVDACRADAACAKLVDCRASCSDDACRAHCEEAGIPDAAAALLACETRRCEAPCGLTCGGAGKPITGCLSCASTCCAEGTAMRASADAHRLRGCRLRCASSDLDCIERCVEAHSEGADLENAATRCVSVACETSGELSCVGHFGPRAATTRTSVEIVPRVVDVDTLHAIVGATVHACSPENPDCPSPIASAQTNAAGDASVTVTLDPATGFDAYPGYVEVSTPGYVPTIIFFTPPVVRSLPISVGLISLTGATYQTFANIVDPTRGHFFFHVLDCAGRSAKGVSMRVSTADAQTRTFYARRASAGGIPFDEATTRTDDSGLGIVLNLPPGRALFTSTVDGFCVDTASAALQIRAGTLTQAAVFPLR